MAKDFLNLYENEINTIKASGKKPKLLLHACCAPCTSGILKELSEYFNVTLFFYNPNISPKEEFDLRKEELEKLPGLLGVSGVEVVSPYYDSLEFFDNVKGLEDEKEGGARCEKCFRIRLLKSFLYAKENNFDYVTTTLTISPYKNAKLLNKIGEELEEEFGIKYLISDFKKKNGYKTSCEMSKIYNLYRQNYCGCIYSKIEAENRLSVKVFDYVPKEARDIREEVFIKEQGFLNEYDEIDNVATHFVIYKGEKPCGTLRIFTKEAPDIYFLGRLAVKKDLRGEGIGSKLVEYALNFVKKQGAKELILHSQLNATEFYKKLGFSEYGEIEYEEDCPHIYMKILL